MTLVGTYPTSLVCRLLDLPRAGLYRTGPPAGARPPLTDALLEQAAEWPTYGYRRLTVMLRRQGWRVNEKRVRRLMHELHLAADAPKRKPRTTDTRCKTSAENTRAADSASRSRPQRGLHAPWLALAPCAAGCGRAAARLPA